MTTSFDLGGKLALVTGSSRGLGRGLALGLADAGARLVIHGRDANALQETADAIERSQGTRPELVIFDVTDAAAVEAGIAELVERVGVPDILVNNAGLQRRAPFAEFPVADWDALVAGNLSGVFYVSRFVAPGMVERGSGKIINIASVQSQLARQTIAPYGATKAGVAQLSRGMAADLARHQAIRDAFRVAAAAEPQRFRVLDGSLPPEAVLTAALAALADARQGWTAHG